jgi:hypothetical protein
MRGHFRYLRFKNFPMTPRTPECEVFCPLLSSSEHSGVPEDSQPPTFPRVGLHPHTWPKWGCDTKPCPNPKLGREVMNTESLGSPNHFGSPEKKCHSDASATVRRREYYMGEGGGFPQIWVVVSQVSLSQPHFGINVRMKLTPPKVGSWSPPGLPKTQSSSSRVKTPCIEVFFKSMERS